MKIERTSLDDSGIYKCIASNIVSSSEIRFITNVLGELDEIHFQIVFADLSISFYFNVFVKFSWCNDTIHRREFNDFGKE